MGGPCEHWVVRSRYLTPDEVAVVADACISELLTELDHGSRLAARWCDERSDALLRAEKAEADAMRLKALADERWEQCKHEAAMREQAEAAAEKWNAANIAATRAVDSLVRERRTLRKLRQRAEAERKREMRAEQDVSLEGGG
jgi:hypothetical protein